MLKIVRKTGRAALRLTVSLSVIAMMLGLPYLHYSKAHLHVYYGVVVAHWHPGDGLVQTASGRKAPIAVHNHSLADLFNLWHIEKNQGNPADIQQPVIFLVQEFKIPAIEIINQGMDYLRSPSGRSPPASYAVI